MRNRTLHQRQALLLLILLLYLQQASAQILKVPEIPSSHIGKKEASNREGAYLKKKPKFDSIAKKYQNSTKPDLDIEYLDYKVGIRFLDMFDYFLSIGSKRKGDTITGIRVYFGSRKGDVSDGGEEDKGKTLLIFVPTRKEGGVFYQDIQNEFYLPRKNKLTLELSECRARTLTKNFDEKRSQIVDLEYGETKWILFTTKQVVELRNEMNYQFNPEKYDSSGHGATGMRIYLAAFPNSARNYDGRLTLHFSFIDGANNKVDLDSLDSRYLMAKEKILGNYDTGTPFPPPAKENRSPSTGSGVDIEAGALLD